MKVLPQRSRHGTIFADIGIKFLVVQLNGSVMDSVTTPFNGVADQEDTTELINPY